MGNQIDKNQKSQQQELRIKELRGDLKKRKRVLKGLKTRLRNMQTRISEFQTTGAANVMHRLDRMGRLRQEIAELSRELKANVTINSTDKYQLEAIADEFGDDIFEGSSFEEFKQNQEAEFQFEFDEEARAKMFDMFNEFQVEPEKEEKKDIRRLFLKLSSSLHPDKAKNDKQARAYHNIMQQINEAYQRNDVQTLLEIEVKYLGQEEFEIDESLAVITDILEQQIEKLERELVLINNQVDRTSGEIKNLRYSQMGALLSQLERAESYGEGIDQALEQMDLAIRQMEKLKKLLEDSIEMGMISIEMRQWFSEPYRSWEAMEWSPFEDGPPKNFAGKNATFTVGTSVKIIKKAMFNGLNIKGWQGRIKEVEWDFLDREICLLEFDSISLLKIPLSMIEELIDADIPFDGVMIEAENLETAPARDTERETLACTRSLYHQFIWKYYTTSKKQEERLRAILLKEPGRQDFENWDLHFEKEVKFPFRANYIDALGVRQSIDVQAILYFDQTEGHIASVKNAETKVRCPCFHFSCRVVKK